MNQLESLSWLRYESKFINEYSDKYEDNFVVNRFETISTKTPNSEELKDYGCPLHIATKIAFNHELRCAYCIFENGSQLIIPVEKIIEMGKD